MPHAPTDRLSQRHDTVRQAMRAASVDALVVLSLPNIAYLSNFGGSTAIVVLTLDRLYFVTDGRYVTAVSGMAQTPHACPGLELVVVDGSYDATLASVLTGRGFRRVGFEAAHLTVSRHRWLGAALGAAPDAPDLVPMEGVVEAARSVKDAYEIERFRAAGAMLAELARQLVAQVRAGITERDLALTIDTAIRQGGFEKPAFETIVASGANSALPHARPTDRKLGEGDLVVLDFGGVYDSYCVDLTRTVVVGSASSRVREVYDAVRQAHDRAIAAAAPGVSRFDVDAAARDHLTSRGMGEAFSHGTGHGLGIEVHEDPRITRRGPNVDTGREPLEAGMVFTVEPGAYFPGWGGIRIEDDVLMTEDGAELLTPGSTELIVV